MNNSVEIAQAQTGKVTAKAVLDVLRAFKGLDISAGLHGTAVHDRPSYSDSFIFRLSVTHRERDREGKRGAETTSEINVPGWVCNGHTSKREDRVYEGRPYKAYCEAYRPTSGFWYLSYEWRRVRDILELLPRDAEIAFFVYLDAGTSDTLVAADTTVGYHAEHGLHSDHLYMVATYMQRGKRVEREFMIAATTGPHNTARFGTPHHDKDTVGRGG